MRTVQLVHVIAFLSLYAVEISVWNFRELRDQTQIQHSFGFVYIQSFDFFCAMIG